MAAWFVWQRLPSSQRRLILRQVGRHGPKAAAMALAYARSRRRAG
jgi:hypothetical protein